MVQGRALQAAIEAGDLLGQQRRAQHRALALELEQATYHATLAARRYEAARRRCRGCPAGPPARAGGLVKTAAAKTVKHPVVFTSAPNG